MSDASIEAEVRRAVEHVDLDIAYSPVLEKPGSKQPVEVERTDGGFSLVWRNALTGAALREPVEVEALRVMRARYLVTRGEVFTAFHTLPEGEQRDAARTMNLGFVPAHGSPLARTLGMRGQETQEEIAAEIVRALRGAVRPGGG